MSTIRPKGREGLLSAGAAVDMTDLTGPHAKLWAKHFNSMIPGNALKWSSVEANKGQYNYSNGDALVDLAVCNAAKVRGQNLVWASGAQTPSYAFGDAVELGGVRHRNVHLPRPVLPGASLAGCAVRKEPLQGDGIPFPLREPSVD